MSTRNYISLGIMTGTSLDGLDLSIIKSDGQERIKFLKGSMFNYTDTLRSSLKNILGSKSRDSVIDSIEDDYTNFIIDKLIIFLKKNRIKIDLIGFHGQTIIHKPDEKISWQIGNAKKIYNYFKVPIVYNFRKNDILNNGKGAPLTPIFHDLIRKKINLRNLIFINLGGISNITISSKKHLISFDCGPCCYLSNDFIKNRINEEYDNNGFNASKGMINKNIVINLMKSNYFKIHPPKSLDRLDFGINAFSELNLYDGLASINEFVAHSIYQSAQKYIKKDTTIIVGGGGRKNRDLINKLKNKFNKKIFLCEEFNINGDLLESYAFAYLAIRTLLKKPISYPRTTGVSIQTVGGDILL